MIKPVKRFLWNVFNFNLIYLSIYLALLIIGSITASKFRNTVSAQFHSHSNSITIENQSNVVYSQTWNIKLTKKKCEFSEHNEYEQRLKYIYVNYRIAYRRFGGMHSTLVTVMLI